MSPSPSLTCSLRYCSSCAAILSEIAKDNELIARINAELGVDETLWEPVLAPSG